MNILCLIVEWIYKLFKHNKIYYDPYSGSYTRIYYEEILKRKYFSKQIFVGILSIIDLKTINRGNDRDTGNIIIRYVIKALYHAGACEVVRLSGGEYLFIIPQHSDTRELENIRYSRYSMVYKAEYEELGHALAEADKKLYLMELEKDASGT